MCLSAIGAASAVVKWFACLNVSDINSPNLIRPADLQVFKQIRVDMVLIDLMTLILIQPNSHAFNTFEEMFEVFCVNSLDQLQVEVALFFGLIAILSISIA